MNKKSNKKYNKKSNKKTNTRKNNKTNISAFLRARELGKKPRYNSVKPRYWLQGKVYNHTTINNKKKMGINGMAAIRKRPQRLKK